MQEICKLQHVLTPVEKLAVLKNVSTLVRENVQKNFERNCYTSDIELATDDLITILIFVIVQASRVYIDIPADIRFILKFHFVSSSQSHLGFTLCNFRVAIAWFVDQVKLSEKVTVVANSILLSPSFSNNAMYGDEDIDFPRKPAEPVPRHVKKAIELIKMSIGVCTKSPHAWAAVDRLPVPDDGDEGNESTSPLKYSDTEKISDSFSSPDESSANKDGVLCSTPSHLRESSNVATLSSPQYAHNVQTLSPPASSSSNCKMNQTIHILEGYSQDEKEMTR